MDNKIINFKRNPWTIRDACEGAICFGATGSGKSSGILSELSLAMLKNEFGGIVFCVKLDEKDIWQHYAAKTGRTNDLLFLSEESFNFLEYEFSRPGRGAGQIENAVATFIQVTEVANNKKNTGGTNDKYWQDALKQLLRNTITLLVMAEEQITLHNIKKVIDTAPRTIEDLEGNANYCCALITRIKQQEKELDPEFVLLWDYFLVEIPNLDCRTTSNIMSTFSVMADAMLRGEMNRCFCADHSTFTPEIIFKGKILIVDYSIKEWNESGSYASAIIKYCFMQAVERRERMTNENEMRPVFLFADEAQYFSIQYDQIFQTTARSSKVATVYATQNIGNLQAVYGEEETNSLLGNLGTKIFCQNGDKKTNMWASESIGKSLTMRKNITKGEGHNTARGPGSSNNESYSEGWNEQKDFLVDPMKFTGLSKGGPGNQCNVEFYVWQSGRLFESGKPFLKTSSKQECQLICRAKKEYACNSKMIYFNYAGIRRHFGFLGIMLLFLAIISFGCFAWAYKLIIDGDQLLNQIMFFSKEINITLGGSLIIGLPLGIISSIFFGVKIFSARNLEKKGNFGKRGIPQPKKNESNFFCLPFFLIVIGVNTRMIYERIECGKDFLFLFLSLILFSFIIKLTLHGKRNLAIQNNVN